MEQYFTSLTRFELNSPNLDMKFYFCVKDKLIIQEDLLVRQLMQNIFTLALKDIGLGLMEMEVMSQWQSMMDI